MKYKLYNLFPEFGTNTILAWDEDSKEGIIIDPSDGSKVLLDEINQLGLSIKYVVNTHGHLDHIGGNRYYNVKFKAPILIHENDKDMLIDSKKNLSAFAGKDITSPKAERLLKDGDIITFGKTTLKVLHTPGHTLGCISLYGADVVFSGDTLFELSVGRTDFPDGSFDLLKKSIEEKLFTLPDSTLVIPGHGAATSIEREKVENPFVGLASRI